MPAKDTMNNPIVPTLAENGSVLARRLKQYRSLLSGCTCRGTDRIDGVPETLSSGKPEGFKRMDQQNKKLGGLMIKTKTNLPLLLFVGAVLLASSSTLFGQSVGDYGSVASGNWSALSTWKQWDGSGWNTTPSAVPKAAVNVYINAGDTVTVDAPDSVSGSIVVNGYLKDVAGLLATGPSVTFNSGSTYELAYNGGSAVPGIPTATWKTGSTCLITGSNGTISSTTGYNANQNFYNLTINAALTSNKDLGMFNNTINGDLTVNNTGSSRIYLTSPSAGSPNTITIKGNVILTAGQFSTNGSSSAATITINSYGNIRVTSSANFGLSRGSGPVVTWNSYGDSLSISNATTQSSGSNNNFIFSKPGTQYLYLNNATFGSGSIPIVVDTGATLDMGIGQVGGSAKFAVDSGATLVSANAGGLDSAIQTSGTKTLSSGASYVFNGTTAQVTGTLLPATVNNLTINNPAGVVLSKSIDVMDTLSLMSGKLMLDSNYVMAAGVSGASASNYVVTDSYGSSFKVANVGSAKVMFPVGTTAEGFSPVWMTNAGTADTFSVSAAMDTSAAVGGGRVNVKWNISENTPGNGNCTLTFGWTGMAENAAFSADRAAFAQIFGLSSVPYNQAGSGTYTSQLTTAPYTLSRGGIKTLGYFGVGKFALAVNPIIGDYGSVGTGNWSSLTTWKQWDGIGWSTIPTVAPIGGVNVFINNGDTVTVDVADSVEGNLVVDGYLKDVAGLKTTGATVVFDSASTYELAYNGGTGVPGIPSATWKTGSTCLITGNNGTISSTTGYNANQNFYNLTINAGFSSNKDLAMFGDTIAGTLTINNTGSARVYLTSPGAGTPNTITIKGNLILQAGQFSSNGSSSPANITVNSYGNIIATGSSNFSISRGSGPVVRWNSYGDTLSLSNATTQTSGSNAVFVFAKQGTQYLQLNNLTFGSGSMPVEVDTGATLVMGTNEWGGDANFTVDSAATIMSGDTTGLNGNIATAGTVSLSSGASYAFNGTVAQTTGSLLPATVANLTVNNSKGVTLSKSVTVSGALALTSGNLMLDTNTVTASSVTGGSSTSYVSTDSAKSYLKVSSVGSTKVMFPVGTTAEGYSPVWITNAGTADAYTVSCAKDTATVNDGGRVNVNWNIGEGTAGGSNLTLQFGWMASAENSVFSSNRAGNSKIYLLTDTTDTEAGTGNYATQFSNQPYTVSRGGITSVGTFAVGNFTTTGVNEPVNIPAEFKLYQNYPNPFNPTTKIEFTVLNKGETSVKVYNILGQQVATLFSADAQPGKKYVVQFNGESLASGVYFSVLQSNGQRQIQKMVLMK